MRFIILTSITTINMNTGGFEMYTMFAKIYIV